MSKLSHFNPFGRAVRFDPFADMDWLKSFGLRPLREIEIEPQIKIDVSEDETAYQVKAEIPGVRKEDIQVSVDGDRVSISAEIRQEKEETKDKKVIHSERYYGQVTRSFALDQHVDRDKAEAKYRDGVLELKLPKLQGSQNRQLPIA